MTIDATLRKIITDRCERRKAQSFDAILYDQMIAAILDELDLAFRVRSLPTSEPRTVEYWEEYDAWKEYARNLCFFPESV